MKSGSYHSPSEIVLEALELLRIRDLVREIRRDELRKEIQKGIDDIREGRCTVIETQEDLDRFCQEIKTEVLERLAEKEKSQAS